MSSVLDEIVSNKRIEVAERKAELPEVVLSDSLLPSRRSLFNALNHSYSDFILECKKASPSRGLIRKDFDLANIVLTYAKYASAISVLTDQKYFQGNFEYLDYVSRSVKQPVLAKDFFVDPYQVIEARFHGADAILLMLSVLSDDEYKLLATKAQLLNLDILTEVHDQQEMMRAIKLDAKIIGINNRNLKDLSIDLETTPMLISKLSEEQKAGRLFISESGISNNQQIRNLANHVSGFLIGSSIMAKKNIAQQCKLLLFGVTKICGITDIGSARCAEQSGSIYGGFIFYQKSPRFIDKNRAKKIRENVSLNWVGVFVNEDIQQLVDIAKYTKLDVIQLHGNESIDYIIELKERLPQIKIWKAIRIKNAFKQDQFNLISNNLIDKVLLDTDHNGKFGGSGESFNWDCLSGLDKERLILAGGLTKKNILSAINVGCSILDINTGVESEPGKKSCQKIQSLFKAIRA